MQTNDARRIASEEGLDLVELVPNANPPVCHILDYGKYKYDESIREKEQRKRQRQIEEKELRFRPGIDDHDIDTKLGHAREFVEKGHKVRLVVRMKGREMAHKDRGFEVLQRIVASLEDIATLDSPPRMDGRTVACRILPKKKEHK